MSTQKKKAAVIISKEEGSREHTKEEGSRGYHIKRTKGSRDHHKREGSCDYSKDRTAVSTQQNRAVVVIIYKWQK